MKENIQQKNAHSSYHPFNTPPNMDICYTHRNCSQFGEVILQKSQQVCPCCNEPPRQTLKLNCKVSQIYQISEPVGYFFSYIKMVTFALALVMLINGVYTLITIINKCSKQNQEQNLCFYVDGIPFPKISTFFQIPLLILNGAAILVLYIFAALIIFRYAYLHQKNLSDHEKPSDYSILLSGVDHDLVTIEHLKIAFDQYDIRDIVYTHTIKKYMKYLSKKSVLDAQLQLYWHRRNMKKVNKTEKKIKKIENKYLHVKNLLTLGQDKQFRTDKVIVTFQQVHAKKQFQQLYGMSLCKNIYHSFCGGSPLVINQCPIFIEPLGEPSQIIWQHLQVTAKSRYMRVFVSNLCSVVFLFGSFVMIVYLTKSEEDRNEVGDALMSLVFAISIQLVNEIISHAIQYLTRWQGRYTMTGQISMKLYKNFTAFFLNTTLLPFGLFIFDFLKPEQDEIIRNILSVFFISNLVSPYVGSYLNPKYLLKLYRRRRVINQGTECVKTQIKANQLFEKVDFMLDQRYALVAQLIMNCMFYAAIFPIGVLITILGMIVTYWSSKWWLLNYCSLPRFSHRLGRHINILSCLFPTIYAFGYAANAYMVKDEDFKFDRIYTIYITAGTIPISILFILFGERIARKWIINHRQSVLDRMDKRKFFVTYKSLNPTTFIHGNLSSESLSNMWDKLTSYAVAKESGFIVNELDQIKSVRNSRLSLNQSVNTGAT